MSNSNPIDMHRFHYYLHQQFPDYIQAAPLMKDNEIGPPLMGPYVDKSIYLDVSYRYHAMKYDKEVVLGTDGMLSLMTAREEPQTVLVMSQ